MFQRIVAVILIVCLTVVACGCYTLKPYTPEQVKPDWEIAEVVKTDSSIVHFDEEETGTIQRGMVVGKVRNEFAELKTRRIPLDSVSFLRVRRVDTSTRMLIVAGVGVGLATFLLIEVLNQHRAKGGSTGGIANSSGGY